MKLILIVEVYQQAQEYEVAPGTALVWHQEAPEYVLAPVGHQVAPVLKVKEDQAQYYVRDPLAPVYLGQGWLDQLGWVARYWVEVPGEELLPVMM